MLEVATGLQSLILIAFLTVLMFFDSMPSRDLPTMSKQQIAVMVFTESKDISLN